MFMSPGMHHGLRSITHQSTRLSTLQVESMEVARIKEFDNKVRARGENSRFTLESRLISRRGL